MTYCVFMHRPDSIYDDSPTIRYQFPKQYLSRAKPSEGNWIVYLNPTKMANGKGYFAIARVQKIIADPSAEDMFLALIEPNTYLEFSNPVPFRDVDGGPVEQGLLNDRGRMSGRAQAAVRPISVADFRRILERGLEADNPVLPRDGPGADPDGFREDQAPYGEDGIRARVLQLTSRAVRTQVFRRIVLRAYDNRCAITGLKLINGGGRAEVNAAHIKPVEANGPDLIQNGIALSATAHWMFDRGLISLSDDLEILVSRHANDQDGIRAFVNRSGRASPPLLAADRPHPRYLDWHRENCFKR